MKDEATYTIPLRREFVKVPRHRRAKRAIHALKAYIIKHTKLEDVKIGPMLNEKIWANGIKNPPGKVTVKAKKKDNSVLVELEGFEYKVEKVQTKKEEPKTLKDKLEAKIDKKEKSPKSEEKEIKEKSTEKKTDEKTKTEPKENSKPTLEKTEPKETKTETTPKEPLETSKSKN
ncbi:50S ribosomal protein L31e [Candidatus Woesearchaeota archaeon]|nr:50S ribosomal protein L31e [Candidatus Woesearchaeota archaeon]